MAFYLKAGSNTSVDPDQHTVSWALGNVEGKLGDIQSQYNLQNYQNVLEDSIKQLKEKEKELFSFFNFGKYERTAAGLQKRIDEIRTNASSLQLLSGPELWTFISKSLAASGDIIERRQIQFTEFLKEKLKDFPQEALNEEKDLVEKNLIEQVNDILNEQVLNKTKTGKIDKRYLVHGIGKMAGAQSVEDIYLKFLTKRQQELAIQALKQQNNRIIATSQVTKDNWYDITNRLKPTEALKKLSIEERKMIMEKLLSFLESKGLSKEVLAAAREVFSQKDFTTFFVGDNIINGISGILGEIQGLYIFRSLIANPNETMLKWIGGLKNPHEDLTLENLSKNQNFGIQIKNTLKDVANDFSKEINFAQRSSNTFLDYLDMNDKQKKVISQIYQLYQFNIEYVKTKRRGKIIYAPGNNEYFAPLREKIENLKLQADLIMYLFSDILMYMGTERAANKIQSSGNLLYLIGGRKLYTASELLSLILKQLKDITNNVNSKQSFRVSSSFANTGNTTIADYFNKRGIGKKNKLKSSQLGSLVLTSSFVFETNL